MAIPKPTQFEVIKSKPFNGKEWRVAGYIDGQRKQYWFSTRQEAKARCGELNQEIAAYGTKVNIDSELRLEASRANEIISEYDNATILDAVRFYTAHRDLIEKSKGFAAFAAENVERYIARKKLSPLGAKTLRETLRKMVAEFGSEMVCNISSKMVSDWLDGLPLSDRSKKKHHGYAHTIFEIALKGGYVKSNPVKATESYKAEDNEITFLTLEEVARLLAHADRETLPLYGIAAFCGLRWAEIQKLHWEDIREDSIVISAAKAKTRARRIVNIPENLKAILAPYRGKTGSVLPLSDSSQSKGKPSEKRLELLRAEVEKAAGFEHWKHNCLRHSFISHLLAKTENEMHVASQAGDSPQMVHQHYKALVTKEAAERYFKAGASVPAENVIDFKVA